MKLSPGTHLCPRNRGCPPGRGPAFTLAELLVVIVIIGLLAAISLPAMRGFAEGSAMRAASRQLLDDLAFARQYAIANRSTVYMVFVPTNLAAINPSQLGDQAARQQLTNLFELQFVGYNLYSDRTVGDQPGQKNPRYLRPWRSLPEGVMIYTNEFQRLTEQQWNTFSDLTNRPLAYRELLFPTTRSNFYKHPLPVIAFDSTGRLLLDDQDEFLFLARGRIFHRLDAQQKPTGEIASVVETPPGNARTDPNWLHIDWLTGRARVERLEVGDVPPEG